MSKWKSVLKSTSVKKNFFENFNTNPNSMDEFMEGLGKVMQEYEKEKTNQPTTATQPTQPTQSRLSEQTKQRVQRLSQKPASGYKSLTQQEVNTFKQGGLPDNKIKELDRKRAESAQQLRQQVEGPALTPAYNQFYGTGDTRTVTTVGDRARQLGQTLARPIQQQSQLATEDIKAIKDALASVAQDVTREGTRQTVYSKDPQTGQITSQQIERAKRKLPPRLRNILNSPQAIRDAGIAAIAGTPQGRAEVRRTRKETTRRPPI